MRLIGIRTGLECILWSDLSVYVWIGGSCYIVTYNKVDMGYHVCFPNENMKVVETITDILCIIKEHSNISTDYWEIEITN